MDKKDNFKQEKEKVAVLDCDFYITFLPMRKSP